MTQRTRMAQSRTSSGGFYVAAAAVLVLTGCVTDGSTGLMGAGPTGDGPKGVSTSAMLGDTALGGMTGSVLVDRPDFVKVKAEAETTRDREHRLQYERQSQIQQERVRKEIEAQRLYEQWKRERGSSPQ